MWEDLYRSPSFWIGLGIALVFLWVLGMLA